MHQPLVQQRGRAISQLCVDYCAVRRGAVHQDHHDHEWQH